MSQISQVICYNSDMEEKAKKIIQKIIYITIATVTKDGNPWNSPVSSAYDNKYNFYWASDKNGQHSKNIRENPNVFLVIYDSTMPEGTGEGVYIQAKAYELTNETEIQHALDTGYKRKGESGHHHEPNEFLGEFPRRFYKAVPEKFWMNGDGDVNGNYIDIRLEVNLLKDKPE